MQPHRFRTAAWVVGVIVLSASAGCKKEGGGSSSSEPNDGAAQPPPRAVNPDSAKPTSPRAKWNISHQLIYQMPWPSEKRPQTQLLADVKDAEATPDQRLVFALNDLGGWYRGQKNYAEAEKIYRRVLKLQQDRLGESHHDVALTFNDLGVVQTESGRPADAEESFNKALDLWQKGWDMPLRTEDEAVTMHNDAELMKLKGDTAGAANMEAKADAIMAERKKAMGL